MVCFGQLVVGPPACGKTTYCNGVSQFMEQMGRQVAIVNLDFANEMTREGMYVRLCLSVGLCVCLSTSLSLPLNSFSTLTPIVSPKPGTTAQWTCASW